MTMKLKARRFRIRADDQPPVEPAPPAAGTGVAVRGRGAGPDDAACEIEAIRREGLTGRQLRMARRMAQKHGLPATSDFDAVRLLRHEGIDPFQRTPLLELVGAQDPAPAEPSSRVIALAEPPSLPGTVPLELPTPEVRAEFGHAAEIMRIQQDIARRRRRRLAMLGARLAFFVLLPTLLAGYYYFRVATPLYATKSEFVIQQAESPIAAGGMGGLLSTTPFATAQDSMAVQGYLQSREAMQRLDSDIGFRSHFDRPGIDPIQRLDPKATDESVYRLYSDTVKIAYDPTEGIIKMEALATDPKTSVAYSTALISYAEEQVDQLTQRMREDQMSGARKSYEEAEAKMLAAQQRVVNLQEKFKVLSSDVEVTLITGQLSQLESQLTTERLSLQQMESNPRPNLARMEPIRRRIATLEAEIAAARGRLTEDGKDGLSLAKVQSELTVAQSDVATRQLLLAQSLEALEAARVEANRQTRYLSLSVRPIEPDEAAYPRAFENTLVVFLIFAGIYLMVSMTVAILREQVSA
ncbi:capsule biosynthesis protein [Rhodobacter sp. CZR27]|uniref:capsule biosynthesis protein n=1 Tax=Rhodobacter sp. CZR27 TaxID=2033869 RepID=UPI000BBE337D|nr:capsule biosynthesis protein [Rhodobacter sp. CZR27]